MTNTATADVLPSGSPPGDDRGGRLAEREPARYSVVAEHGRGGLGRVMRAHDKDLGRDVAIKEMLRQGGTAELRFVREAMITARLEHPGIVPVHDAGRWPDGTPFYSMKLVSGRSLKSVFEEASTPQARLALLPHVIAVADAIAYAHDRGIIHRDLKPSNVIVGDFGETIVIDWGLAKDLSKVGTDVLWADPYRTAAGAQDVTVAGVVLGTPAYMPPEQARGEEVAEPADIYSLGAILYHLLTGSPPYSGTSSAQVLAALASGPPRPILEREPHVPADLAAIAAKAMSRDSEDRYPSAMSLVEDLRRFQSGQLVLAHAYSALAQVRKWARRHPAIVTTVAATVVVSIVATMVGYSKVTVERDEARAQRGRAEGALKLAYENNSKLILSQASAFLTTDPTTTIAWLKSYEGDDQDAPRTLAATALARGVARLVVPLGVGQILQLKALSDGRAFLFASQGSLAEGDLSGGATKMIYSPAESMFDVTADETKIVFASDRKVLVHDRKMAALRELGLHESTVTAVVAARSGEWFASASMDGVLRIWKLNGDVSTVASNGPPIAWLSASPDGRYLAWTSQDNKVALWDARSGVRILLESTAAGSRLAFSDSGRFLAWSNPE